MLLQSREIVFTFCKNNENCPMCDSIGYRMFMYNFMKNIILSFLQL